jgi:cytoskeletal protein CcmA (bactofilin family)
MLRQRVWIAWLISISLVALLALPATAMALTRLEGDSVTVARGQTITDDLYAFGNIITIEGTVDGDLIAFGQTVVVNGDVRGSVMGAAQTVRIGGTVGGSVRAAGALVDVGGQVGGDVLAGAGNVIVGGSVVRDLVAGAQNVTISGTVGRDVAVGSTSLLISGNVGGDVQAQSTNVTVTNTGAVSGSLDYWSTTPANVSGSVTGETTQYKPVTTSPQAAAAEKSVATTILTAFYGWLQSLVGFVILGVILVFALREPMERGSQAVLDRTGVSLGIGAIALFATPLAVVIVFGFGLFVGAWWLSFVLAMLYALLLLAGVIVGSLAVGRAILSRAAAGAEPALAWSVLLGVPLVWIVAAVPVVGWLAGWAVGMIGAGALVLLIAGKAEKPATPIAAASGQMSAPPPVMPNYPQPSH